MLFTLEMEMEMEKCSYFISTFQSGAVSQWGRIVIIIIISLSTKSFLFRTCIRALSLLLFCALFYCFRSTFCDVWLCSCYHIQFFSRFHFVFAVFIIDHMMSMILCVAAAITIQYSIKYKNSNDQQNNNKKRTHHP